MPSPAGKRRRTSATLLSTRSWALSSPPHGQHHVIITERKDGACEDPESQGSARATLGYHLTLLSPTWSSGLLAVEASLHCTPTLGTAVGAGMEWDHEGNTEPNFSTCKGQLSGPAVGELARATGTVTVTLASLWHCWLELPVLCSPRGEMGC